MIFLFTNNRKNTYNTNLIYDVLNVLNDSNLKNVPFLFLFDKLNKDMEDIYELLRKELSLLEYDNYNIQFINFITGGEEVFFGLDWLCDTMKPLLG